jgi:hypothetical protein
LTRSVSQTTCLHDLFWCFTASLTPPLPDTEEEVETEEKKKVDKKEIEQVRNLLFFFNFYQLLSQEG